MSLTRKQLVGMGLTAEQVDSIIEAHSETVEGLKAEITKYKADADKIPELQSALDSANKTIENNGKDSFKVKYEALKEEFDAYKNDIASKETRASREKAYTQVLRDLGIPEKRISSIVKVSDLDNLELDESGKIKDESSLKDSLKDEWADFIQTAEEKGADVANPPRQTTPKAFTADDIKNMTPDEINANYDAIRASLKN